MQYKAYANLPDVLEAHWEKTKRLTCFGNLHQKIKEDASVIVSEVFTVSLESSSILMPSGLRDFLRRIEIISYKLFACICAWN